ncbi:hypothetical protein GJ496_001019 [Pomphorhynchus laevis]|nr:hypothetical protein GJ496_001019 [Pomphorhynchus laevis]
MPANKLCQRCIVEKAVTRRCVTLDTLCKSCFTSSVENDVFGFIEQAGMIRPNDRVGIGASGGKDSTVLIHILKRFNDLKSMNLDLHLLSIDEGIVGYRDQSLATVQQNSKDYNLPLHIHSYQDLYGTTMDSVVDKIGMKNNCTVCGVFRRKALETAAKEINADVIVTGHNADDMAETNLLNIVRGDISRLVRKPGEHRRCKPLERLYEKDIVLYAHFNKLKYFSTECTYFHQSHRGYLRDLIKQLESVLPSCIQSINDTLDREINDLQIQQRTKPLLGTCSRCGEVSSMNICKACNLEEGLKSELPFLGVGKTEKIRRRNNLEPLVFYRE